MFIVLLGLGGLVGAPVIYAQGYNQPPSVGQSTPQAQPSQPPPAGQSMPQAQPYQSPSRGESMQQSQSQPHKEVSDKELQAFAKAYVEIQKIKNSQQGSLKNTPDPQQAQKIQQETNAEMAKAVQKQGFTPEAYTQILATVNGDNTLSKKALELIQKERAS
jgi:hypothetical protein